MPVTTRVEGRAERLGRGRAAACGHSAARARRCARLKLSQQARRGRGSRGDVTEALELLLADRADAARRLDEPRRLSDQATATPRLVQATIPADLDTGFSELRLDLADELGRDVSYEQLWAAALLLWVRTYR